MPMTRKIIFATLIIVTALTFYSVLDKIIWDVNEEQGNPTPDIRYSLQKDGIMQNLNVQFKEKGKIIFNLNREGVCTRQLSGIAVSGEGDYEIDEENDEAYPAEEFWYKGDDGCELYIRIDVEQKSRVKIKEASCKNTCLFEEEIMKSVESR